MAKVTITIEDAGEGDESRVVMGITSDPPVPNPARKGAGLEKNWASLTYAQQVAYILFDRIVKAYATEGGTAEIKEKKKSG